MSTSEQARVPGTGHEPLRTASPGGTRPTSAGSTMRLQLRGLSYAHGSTLLAPVQLKPPESPTVPATPEGGRDKIDACVQPLSGYQEEATFTEAIQCLNGVGADVSDALFDKSLTPQQRLALRPLLDEVGRRIAIAEQGLADFRDREGGPQASNVTRILALAFGENTVGMHLRPRAREGIRGSNAMRLAAATAAYGATKVFDRWALGSFASNWLDEIFADVRGEAAPPVGETSPEQGGPLLRNEQVHERDPNSQYVYRGGSATDQNLTPRAPQDLTGDKRGLSTFSSPEQVEKNGFKKAQEIDVGRLGDELDAIPNGSGPNDSHVSIRPDNDVKLLDWANSRASGGHTYTAAVRRAILRETKLPIEQPR